MQTFSDCFICILNILRTGMEKAGADQETQVTLLHDLIQQLAEQDPATSPSEISGLLWQHLRGSLRVDDFYETFKLDSNKLAFSMLDDLRKLAAQADDPLEMALKVSAAGNIIDVIHVGEYDLWQEVVEKIEQPLCAETVRAFKDALVRAHSVLYLADNAGETVFDRVLIETLDRPVAYAVKSGAILNDATYADALAAGIDQVAEIIETGSRLPGTVLTRCTPEFNQRFRQADLVIAKGQANYETLDQEGDRVFFLLRIKCPIISREIGYPVGRLVLERA